MGPRGAQAKGKKRWSNMNQSHHWGGISEFYDFLGFLWFSFFFWHMVFGWAHQIFVGGFYHFCSPLAFAGTVRTTIVYGQQTVFITVKWH